MKPSCMKMPTLRGAGKPNQPCKMADRFGSTRMTKGKGKNYSLLGFLDLKITFIILVLGGGGAFFGLKSKAAKPQTYRITWKTPKAGGAVNQTNLVQGTIYPVPKDKTLWIFQQPSFGGAYSKRPSVEEDGDFTMPMPFGNEAHPGWGFQLYGMVLPPETHFGEMADLGTAPRGAKISPITVLRR